MPKIAFLPIDNRPVCYQLPKQIANLDEANELFLPDRTLLGDLKKIADIEGLFSWLEEIEMVDIIVLSLDTIAYFEKLFVSNVIVLFSSLYVASINSYPVISSPLCVS